MHFLNFNINTCIRSLRKKSTKLHIFFKWTPINIKINAFSICVVHLLFGNKNIQLILVPYAIHTYWTKYMTKINKLITIELYFFIQKFNIGKINANIWIWKLSKFFLMFNKWLLFFSLPLYHYSLFQQSLSSLPKLSLDSLNGLTC
jgi:hypothetical protein